ncbi:hypothetical protein BVRB_2g036120 [Beta vulgaris subsp. vulgaris]|nr:hypothetical protein BVRB_2g036120 [Beta vulgaris subsp. vulgaris]
MHIYSSLKKFERTGKVPQWKAMKCVQLIGGIKCGYYLLRFMFNIISSCKDDEDLEKLLYITHK